MSEPAGDWDASYQRDDPPPWDIGRPQPVFEALAAEGRLAGDVLDAGCGTGEHALLAASRGARVTGVDLAETAIRRAQEKAAERGLEATFASGDILAMALPPQGFDVVMDSGLFHVFVDEARARYVDVLRHVLRPGGTCYLMCFSDQEPGDWGPRRVTRAEIEAAFADGWTIERLEPSAFDINPIFGATTAKAWLAVLRRS
jgi:SAM-dependent methyltransferase